MRSNECNVEASGRMREDETINDDDDTLPRSRSLLKPGSIVGIIALVIVIVVGSVFGVSRLIGSSGQASPQLAPAEASVFPESNLYYFYQSPSWGSITVDGHLLAPVPEPGSNLPPLQLSVGIHQVVWHADPFPAVHCFIYIPVQFVSESCVGSEAPLTLAGPDGRSLTAYLISFSLSLADLSVPQFNALTQAIDATLGSLQGSEMLLPGEHFASMHNTSISIETASMPLRAILKFISVISANTFEGGGPCVAGGLIDQPDSCANNGQSCVNLCPFDESGGNASTKRWIVLAPMVPDWYYTALNGQAVLQDQPDPATTSGVSFLVALSLNWTGSKWQVSFYHSPRVDSSPIANPACDAAQFTVGEDPRFLSVMNSSQAITWKYVSGTNAAAGCVAEAFAQTGSGTPSRTDQPLARCLYRFGVLLALDTEAHRSWPFLPLASTYEQQIALQI